MTRDAEIEAAWVESPPEHNASIKLSEYDRAWPDLYEAEATRINKALGDRIIRLEHVGSTSVPGLCAKPIIDILLEVADSSNERAWLPLLEAKGYTLKIREPDWHQHRMLKGPDTDLNLHVFSAGSSESERLLRLRDWLRLHPDDRREYEAAKRELAGRTWKYVQHYADAKTQVIEAILARAITEH